MRGRKKQRYLNPLIFAAILSALSCQILESDEHESAGLIIYSTDLIKPAVYLKNLNTGKTEVLLTNQTGIGEGFGIAVNPSFDQMIYTVKEVSYDNRINIRSYKDHQFYLMDLKKKDSRPLRGKLVEPDFFAKELIKYKAKASDEEIPVIGSNPVWSPDGKKLAYTKISFPQIGAQDLYVYDLEKEEIRPLAYNINFEMNPKWSLDSNAIIYETNEGLPGTGFSRNIYRNFRSFRLALSESEGEVYTQKKGAIADTDKGVFVLEGSENSFLKYDISTEETDSIFFYQTEDTVLFSEIHNQIYEEERVILTFRLFDEKTGSRWTESKHWGEYIGFYDFKNERFIKLETFAEPQYIGHVFWKDLPYTIRGNNYF